MDLLGQGPDLDVRRPEAVLVSPSSHLLQELPRLWDAQVTSRYSLSDLTPHGICSTSEISCSALEGAHTTRSISIRRDLGLVKSSSSDHGSFFADLAGFRLGLDLDDSTLARAMAEAEDSPASLGCATRAVHARRGLQHPQHLVMKKENFADLGAPMGFDPYMVDRWAVLPSSAALRLGGISRVLAAGGGR